MALEDFLTLNVLIPFDVAIYASLIVGVMRTRRRSFPRVKDISQAFALLEKSLWKAFPDLPVGFTLREALARAEDAGLDTDWSRVQVALERYEAFRYGGVRPPEDEREEEVLKLLAILPRGVRVGS